MACLDVWEHVTQSQLPACASCMCHRHVHALHEGTGSAGDLVKIRLLRQAVNMFMGSHDMQSTLHEAHTTCSQHVHEGNMTRSQRVHGII